MAVDVLRHEPGHDGPGRTTPLAGRPSSHTGSDAGRSTGTLPRHVVDRPHGETLLERLTEAAADGVPGADHAGLTGLEHGTLVSWASSHPHVVDLDRLQVVCGEGPCLDTVVPDASVSLLVGDLAAESRWPRFAPAAAGHGVRSLLSFALGSSEAGLGVLTFYSARPHAFDAASQSVGAALARQAAVTVHGVQTVARLERGLQTRDVIGQAKGILMERYGLDGRQAFDRLVRSSQETNLKLFAVARWLVDETGERAASREAPTG